MKVHQHLKNYSCKVCRICEELLLCIQAVCSSNQLL